MMYVLSYNCEDGYDENDIFEGSWLELQDFIKMLRQSGCTNISACALDDE